MGTGYVMISKKSRWLLVLAAICVTIALFVPVWYIYLDAPQYPEGLRLNIWVNKLAGDVDIINGLNHYIGMKTLHSNDFVEFTWLPYILTLYALLFVGTALYGRRKWLNASLVAFIIFGVVAMADFWKWEYDYGHNLDPAAAIKVPGMAYQPPLIGFKQLLNFGAYSIPAAGGWLLLIAGVSLVVAVLIETFGRKLVKRPSQLAMVGMAAMILSSCGNSGPQAIDYNKDACEFCKMSISVPGFATELITTRGRVYKFDDLSCMLAYTKANPQVPVSDLYVTSFVAPHEFIKTPDAWFVRHETLKSPMGGNTAAFSDSLAALKLAADAMVKVLNWQELRTVGSNNKK